jgi:hypothetical protein
MKDGGIETHKRLTLFVKEQLVGHGFCFENKMKIKHWNRNKTVDLYVGLQHSTASCAAEFVLEAFTYR